VSVAVIGTGSIGMRHLRVLSRVAAVRAVAIPKRPERLPALDAAGYHTAIGLDEAVRNGVRLCIVASDTGRHVPDALAAMERGCDILVEKPLAPEAASAELLRRRADAESCRLFVGCVLRFSRSLDLVRKAVGMLGRLHAVRIECQSYLPDWRPGRAYQDSYSAREEEGGVLRDLIHEIDYAGWLFGWPRAVQARVSNLGRLGIRADELAQLNWEGADGSLVSIGLDYLSRPTRRWMRVCGERGTIEWDGLTGVVRSVVDGPQVETCLPQSPDELILAQDMGFIRDCMGTREPLLASGADGVRALAVCNAAREASTTGRETRVAYP
jgi:predicted dehydrogenase